MKRKTTICFLLLFAYEVAISQEINVSIDASNQTIELTDEAINEIKVGNFVSAVDHLTKAIEIDSTFHKSYTTLYQAAVSGKIYSDTIVQNLMKAKRLFHEDDEICFYLGEIYRLRNNIELAIKEYTLAIDYSKINGEDFELIYSYYFNRGNSYLKMNLYDQAITDYSYSLKLNPIFDLAFINRATCYFKKGDKPKACNDWAEANRLGNEIGKKYIEKYCNK